MVSTIKVSAYISLEYVQIIRKTVRDLRNNNSKAIDIHHDQDGHNLVEYPCKSTVFGQHNNVEVTWISSTIYSAHYGKIGGANSR